MNYILQSIRRLIDRLFIRRDPHAIMAHPQLYGGQGNAHENVRSDSDNSNDLANMNRDFMSTINQALAPTHGEDNYLYIQRFDEESRVHSHSEKWTFEDNSMHVEHRKSLVSTCSGATVQPAQITGKCEVGDDYDSEFFRCGICGRLVCRRHGYVLPLPNNTTIVLCPRHLRSTIDNWNTWKNGPPPTPYSLGRK